MSTTNFSNDPGTTTTGAEGSSGVKDQAQQAAGTAADESKRVAGVAKDEVKNVTSEAQTQLRGLLDEATTQVDEQSKAQKTRLAETVRTFGDDLDAMHAQGEDGGGLAAQVVQQVAEQARGLASHLDGKEPTELLDDVRQFARRRPGAFLLGALTAGVVVGRLTRGAKAAQSEASSDSVATATSPGSGISAPQVGIAPEVGHTDVAYTGADLSDADAQPGLGAQQGLGAPAVEMSEAGVRGHNGDRA